MTRESTRPEAAEGPCADYEWLLGPYIDGELPDGEGARLEEHLGSCSSCKTLSEQFQSLNHLARDHFEPPPRVSAGQWGEMWEEIRKQTRGSTYRPARSLADWIVPALSVAALFLLAFWLGYAILNERPSKEPPVAKTDDESSEVVPLKTDEGYIIDFTNS